MTAQKANPRRATRRYLNAAKRRAIRADNDRFWREWNEQTEREWVAANAGKLIDAVLRYPGVLSGFARGAQ